MGCEKSRWPFWSKITPVELMPKAKLNDGPKIPWFSVPWLMNGLINGLTGYVRDSTLLKIIPELDCSKREAEYLPITKDLLLVCWTNLLTKFE